MRQFVDTDFPMRAIGNRVYCRWDSSPICTATDDEMALEIAKRLNRDNQVYPETQELDNRERWGS